MIRNSIHDTVIGSHSGLGFPPPDQPLLSKFTEISQNGWTTEMTFSTHPSDHEMDDECCLKAGSPSAPRPTPNPSEVYAAQNWTYRGLLVAK